ncbi:MAG: ATP-grasp domain-containing protein [Candidatus Thorarchaeota archaeon]
MTTSKKILQDKNIGVVGFNARPLACSAYKAGGNAYVSDYWGDSDLNQCSKDWVAVLSSVPGSRQRGTLESPVYITLAKNFLEVFSETRFDFILIGSGFDDHSESLARIEGMFGITGNSVEQMKLARNRSKLRTLANRYKIGMPQESLVEDKDDAIKSADDIGYPCVVRPITSGGGAGIRVLPNSNALERYYAALEDTGKIGARIIQEYVPGWDVSASVLGARKEAMTLSVQGQLIGLPSTGRNCDFAYGGNYYPPRISENTNERIRHVSEAIIKSIGLIGSNGIDYVVDKKGDIWLFEVNPRFQGSLEMLEHAGNISISELHVNACNGELPNEAPKFKPIVKMIVYAVKDGIVPDLSIFPNSVDRSPAGVGVQKGDPICSVIEIGHNLRDAYTKAKYCFDAIQKGL